MASFPSWEQLISRPVLACADLLSQGAERASIHMNAIEVDGNSSIVSARYVPIYAFIALIISWPC
jgi:hypothetical protein